MFTKSFLVALSAASYVAAHGKVSQMTGDMGGNGTALGILGGVVPGPGPNGKTEVDTTVFKSTNIMTDGLGKTNGGGKNNVAGLSRVMAQSGNTLPQVSPGGTLSGTWHTVTDDGAGPVRGVLDPTGTGSFSQGIELKVVQQVPGKGGRIRPDGTVPGKRSIAERAIRMIFPRAAKNINTDNPVALQVPAGTKCTGTMGGMQNVCLVKIANANRAGPFGGVVPIQIADSGAAVPAGGAAVAAASVPAAKGAKAAAPKAAAAAAPKVGNKNAKNPAARREVSFQA